MAWRNYHENRKDDTGPLTREEDRLKLTTRPADAGQQVRVDAFHRWSDQHRNMTAEQRTKLDMLVRADMEAEFAVQEERRRFEERKYGDPTLTYARPDMRYERGRTEALPPDEVRAAQVAAAARYAKSQQPLPTEDSDLVNPFMDKLAATS